MEVFRRNPRPKEIGLTVATVLGLIPTKGEVGLEIEMEGKHLLHMGEVPPPWKYYQDGSLRGEENAEYVLKSPVAFDKVDKALDALWDGLKKKDAKLDDSNRTSVHVHLNVQNFHLNRLASFAAIYAIVEEVLTEWCGDHRVGNLFCLRAKDAPAIITQMKQFILKNGKYRFGENMHYSGMNIHAINKFGSLEFRTLRGVADSQIIKDWVKILRRLYDLSADFSDPRQIPAMFSAEGPLAFFDFLLGPMAGTVRLGISFDNDRIRDSMYDGIRMAQDLCYCRDWGVFEGLDIKEDPFGRDARKVAKRVVSAAQDNPAPQPVTVAIPPAQGMTLGSMGPFQQAYLQAVQQTTTAPVNHTFDITAWVPEEY